MKENSDQLRLAIDAASVPSDQEVLEKELDDFVNQGRGTYADARRILLPGSEATERTVSLRLVEPAPEAPLKGKHTPGARSQARGETTPAKDGFWSNYA